METAFTYQADLDFAKARQAFEAVLQEKPGHRKALSQLFLIDKHEPDEENFHNTADRLLAILARNTSSEDDCLNIYREYITLAKPAKLSVETNLSINRILLKKGMLPEAAAITTFLLKKHTGLPQLPGCLLNLGKAYQHHGAFANSAKCLQLLCKIYPDSPECETAGSMKRKRP
jgi:tetratricopeptide (TPR) repeat protein